MTPAGRRTRTAASSKRRPPRSSPRAGGKTVLTVGGKAVEVSNLDKVLYPELGLTKVVVSEAGASVYSASAFASQELPDMDVSLRGAVSISPSIEYMERAYDQAKYGEYAKGMGVTEEFLSAFNTRLQISIDRVWSTPPND